MAQVDDSTKPLDVVGDRRAHQIEGVGDVVADVEERLAHRLADQRVRGEVQDTVKAEAPEQAVDSVPIGKIADDELGVVVDRLAVPLLEVVEDNDTVPARQQVDDDVAADIAGAAGHEIGPGHVLIHVLFTGDLGYQRAGRECGI